ncbi:MAG TPA: DUF4292 domain-containing protein [Chryseosolibacter sp.]|nr:DUF4292 domain-containing protein [Chryseosolibacter sp.]
MNRSVSLLLVFVVIISACSRKTAPATGSTPKSTLNIEEIDFEYFHGKARMILRDANKEREVKANIRVRKDSVIWMTFSVVGVQGGKALINKDSITIVSTMDKEYYVFDYRELSKRFNLDINYQVIQAAMLGNPILPRKESDEVQPESSMFLLKQQVGDVAVINYVNAASQKIEKVEMKEGNSTNSLVINYSNFQPVGNKVFPYNGTINLFYKAVAGLLNTTIIFEYNKAEVGNRELNFPFNIPKRYDRR